MYPTLLDNVLIPQDFVQFIYHVRSDVNMHFIIALGLIADEKWVDQEEEHDMSQPRHARYKLVWKVAQDAVYWVDAVRAERMGLKFYQTRSNAIILHDTQPSTCIDRVVSRKNCDILYTRNSESPRPARTITLKANWQTNSDQNAEAPAGDSQLARTGKPESLKSRTMLDQHKRTRSQRQRI